jgi:hypothetical protein
MRRRSVIGLFGAAIAIGAGITRLMQTHRVPEHTGVLNLPMRKRADWQAAAVRKVSRVEFGDFDARLNPNGWRVYEEPLTQVLRSIVIHHSALPLTDGPREIQQLHFDGQGLADIAYHFLIDARGILYEGRDITVRGAHVGGHNTGSVGVCLLGNFENADPTQVQRDMLDSLVIALRDAFGITHLAGHRDFQPGATVCPGERFAPILPALAATHGLVFGVGGYRSR